MGLLKILDPIRGSDILSVGIKLVLAMLTGGFLGLERRRKRRPAGFRTHILVCMGAALAVAVNFYLADLYEGYSKLDAARLGAQVINGIGFLGAGSIIITGRQQVKGLTTAAGLWASACMGLSIGAGYYECALLACVFIYLTITVFNNLEKVLTSRSRNMNIAVITTDTEVLRKVKDKLAGIGCDIYDIEITNIKNLANETPNAVIEMHLSERRQHSGIIAEVAVIDGVISVEEPE